MGPSSRRAHRVLRPLGSRWKTSEPHASGRDRRTILRCAFPALARCLAPFSPPNPYSSDVPRRKVTGGSLSILGFGGGLDWDKGPTDEEIASALLNRLADRRVLFNPCAWEMPEHCVMSVLCRLRRVIAVGR